MKTLIFGNHDENTHKQIDSVMESGAERYVQCADGHLGYSHPIGGVAAYRDHISLSGVGYDIGCGNTIVRTDIKGRDLLPKIESIMDQIFDHIAFGIGRTNKYRFASDFWDNSISKDAAWDIPFVKTLKPMAESQLGTVGSGNHYVDLFVEDATDDVWVGVHFGSRGLGHKIATHYMGLAGAKDDMMSPPTLLEAGSDIGLEYLNAMSLAGEYAYLGRLAVITEICRVILGGVGTTSLVNNHHNFAWQESHFGNWYWVVRKGATPAFPNQKGFIGGSMGDDAVIVKGIDSEMSRNALYSTVHGAGRVMSRSEAKGKSKVNKQTGEVRVIKEPKVNRQEAMDWIKKKGVTVRGGDLDEAPQAYRRLDDVLDFHKGTIEILHRLRPVGVAMAGEDVKDPYKD